MTKNVLNLDKILPHVASPARYTGGEFNSYTPKLKPLFNFLLAFPDVYEVGMSNLGMKILYGLLNERAETSCQMVFTPWPDMADTMRREHVPLFSLTSRTPAKEFDMIGFSLPYEISYTNVLTMLDLAGLELYACNRSEADPIILGGGSATLNPAPIAPFFDILAIGDGEEVMAQIAELYEKHKAAKGTKVAFLQQCAHIKGLYVPSVHDNQFNANPSQTIKRAVVHDLENAYYPTKIQVANVEAVHNRAMLELFRGCVRGCRFCQASFVARPIRNRSPERLSKLAAELIAHTGYDEMSLSSLSTSDYPHLRPLLEQLAPHCREKAVRLTLPSTRVDSFVSDFVENNRKSSITFAPEAGSQRLRDVINKNVTEEDILSACAAAFSMGYATVKLYFMIGLPTETEADIDAIVDLAKKIKWSYKKHASNKKSLSLSVAASTFVPKPFTPFQWEAQIPYEETRRIQFKLKDTLKRMGIKFSFHDAGTSKLESALARGGAAMADVIVEAYKKGAKFDAWSEFFNIEIWQEAFKTCGINFEQATAALDTTQTLPWDRVDVGVTKAFLLQERERALQSQTTQSCDFTDCKQNKNCIGCGANKI